MERHAAVCWTLFAAQRDAWLRVNSSPRWNAQYASKSPLATSARSRSTASAPASCRRARRAFHAVFPQVATRALDHARRDRQPGREVRVVSHHRGVLAQVGDAHVDGRARRGACAAVAMPCVTAWSKRVAGRLSAASSGQRRGAGARACAPPCSRARCRSQGSRRTACPDALKRMGRTCGRGAAPARTPHARLSTP